MINKIKNTKGVTLIALVITIVILLILSGVSILAFTGENGMFNRAKQARNNTLDAEKKESLALESYENKINEILEENQENNEDEEKMYIFKNGNQYTDITGGWISCAYYSTAPTLSITDKLLIKYETQGTRGGGTVTKNKVDVTNFNKLCFNSSENSNGSIGITDSQNTSSYIKSANVRNFNELELSGTKGFYYIKIIINSDNGPVFSELSEIWLEK